MSGGGRGIRSGTAAALCELITARRIIENGELIIIFYLLFIHVIYSQCTAYTSVNYSGTHAQVNFNDFT